MFDVFLSLFSFWISNITPGSKAFLCSEHCCFIWAALRITGKLYQLASTPYLWTMLMSTTPPVLLCENKGCTQINYDWALYRVNTALSNFEYAVEAMMITKECILQPLIQTEHGLSFQLVSNYHKILYERSLSLLGTWILLISLCLLYHLYFDFNDQCTS